MSVTTSPVESHRCARHPPVPALPLGVLPGGRDPGSVDTEDDGDARDDKWTACILVVEDDPPMRQLLVDMLNDASFTICAAENGDEALGLIRASALECALLVTDIQMPGSMNGIDIARTLRKRFPVLPVIFVTGAFDVAEQVALEDRQVLMLKPISPLKLREAARRLLSS